MGWQGIVAPFVQAGNTVILNGNGLFVYNGTPGTGTLVANITPTGGTDQYGNVYQANDGVYGASGSFANLATNNGFKGFPAVTLKPPSIIHNTTLPQVASDNNNPGAANEQSKLVLSSGKEGSNTNDDGAIILFSESNDTTIGAAVVIEFGGAFIISINRTTFLLGDGLVNPPIQWRPANSAHVTQNPFVQGLVLNPGAANEQNELFVSSGRNNGLDDAAFQMFSESNDATGLAQVTLELGGNICWFGNKNLFAVSVPISATLGTPTNKSIITNGGYTRVASPYSNGWVSSGGGTDMQGIIYQMLNNGNYEVWFDIINPAAQTNSVVTNLPAPFRPQKNFKHPVTFLGNCVWMQFNTNGDVVAVGNTAANTEICGRCEIPTIAIP